MKNLIYTQYILMIQYLKSKCDVIEVTVDFLLRLPMQIAAVFTATKHDENTVDVAKTTLVFVNVL